MLKKDYSSLIKMVILLFTQTSKYDLVKEMKRINFLLTEDLVIILSMIFKSVSFPYQLVAFKLDKSWLYESLDFNWHQFAMVKQASWIVNQYLQNVDLE